MQNVADIPGHPARALQVSSLLVPLLLLLLLLLMSMACKGVSSSYFEYGLSLLRSLMRLGLLLLLLLLKACWDVGTNSS